MNVSSAVSLIGRMAYKPGWSITAEDMTDRHEETIRLHVVYPAANSDREMAPDYRVEVEGGARAAFPVVVADCDDIPDLARKILNVFMKIECHEAREFLRIGPDWWAPFHPHRVDGQKRWGDPEGDLQFGVA